MSKKEDTPKQERYKFSPEELERMEQHLEQRTTQEEIIGLLDGYSGSFADWSVIISEAVHDKMERKQKLNEDCDKERQMLENMTFMLTKLAYHSAALSDWHKRLSFGKGYTEQMIEDGHP